MSDILYPKEIIDELTKYYMKAVESDFVKVIRYVNRDLYKDVSKMYDAYFDQFYEYKTTSYIRHGQSKPGTGNGENLYRAIDIYMLDERSNSPKLHVGFNPSDMEDGYQHDNKFDVFNMVYHGIRFPYYNNGTAWTGDFRGRWFKFSGRMSDAFNLFDATFDDIAETAFNYYWKRYTKWRNI